MRTKVILTVAGLFIFMFTGFSQATFSVSQGYGISDAQIGYKVSKNIIPYFGFQFVSISGSTESNYKEFDLDQNSVISETNEYKMSGGLYIPTVGLKYLFSPEAVIKPYVSMNISKPLLRASAEENGKKIEEINEQLKKIKLFGGELGFGVEYFFHEKFSIGGEFGIRYWHVGQNDTYESSYYNPNTNDYVEYDREIKSSFSVSPTYSKVSINFYL